MIAKPVKIGVIGTGGMGGRHARNLARRALGAQVAAVMDVDQKRVAAVAAECANARAFDNADELIASPEVEAVLIASPHSTHAELTLACLRAHKPVLCEKPLAETVADAQKVVAAEAALGRRLVQVGFMREYDPAHKDVKAILDSGEIGRGLLFRSVHINKNNGSARSIEDVVNSSAVHDMHSARWIMGCEVLSVFAQCIPASADQPDTCRLLSVQMRLENGTLAVLEVNADSGYGYEVDVEVKCEKGSLSTNALRSAVVRHDGARSQAIEADWLARFDRAYIDEAQAWVDSLNAGACTGPSAWDGYMSLVVTQACVDSINSGQAVTIQAMPRPALY